VGSYSSKTRTWAAAVTVAMFALSGNLYGDGLPPGSGSPGKIIRDPVTGKIKSIPRKQKIHVCVAMTQSQDCDTTVLQTGVDDVALGGTVILHSGKYPQAAKVRTNDIWSCHGLVPDT
jgi:hypothetical protein